MRVRHILSALSLPLLLLASVSSAQASGLVATELSPMAHRTAALAVVMPDGERRSYTPAEIEAFETFQLVTTTPWRETPATFEGIRLRDFLAAHDLEDAEGIKIKAENDFVVTMTRDVWLAEDFLIATRVDGRPHSRRARGPIQFVLDWDAYQRSAVAEESHLVWMAAEIAPMF